MSIEITVLFDVVPGRMESVAAAFQELCDATRQEEGALGPDEWQARLSAAKGQVPRSMRTLSERKVSFAVGRRLSRA